MLEKLTLFYLMRWGTRPEVVWSVPGGTLKNWQTSSWWSFFSRFVWFEMGSLLQHRPLQQSSIVFVPFLFLMENTGVNRAIWHVIHHHASCAFFNSERDALPYVTLFVWVLKVELFGAWQKCVKISPDFDLVHFPLCHLVHIKGRVELMLRTLSKHFNTLIQQRGEKICPLCF